jgi:hypothetical protein
LLGLATPQNTSKWRNNFLLGRRLNKIIQKF